MCSGGNKKAKARKKAKRQKKKAERREEKLEQIAKEREAIAKRQEQERRRLESQQAAMVAQQRKKVSEVEQKFKTRVAGMKAESERQVAGIRNAGGAAATSLRILGQAQPTAPTAQQTPRNSGRRGAGVTAADVARGSAQNRGFNLSI